MRLARPLLASIPIVALSASLPGCASPGQAVPDSLWSSPPERLRDLNPNDVAVLPVLDETKRSASAKDAPPLSTFRKTAYEELLGRKYSPLALPFVDQAIGAVEASSPGYGACEEDASLRIVIQRFDDSDLVRDPAVKIAAECYLHDAQSGEVIWSARAFRTVSLRVEAKTLHDPALLREIAAERFVRYALGGLPAREIRARE